LRLKAFRFQIFPTRPYKTESPSLTPDKNEDNSSGGFICTLEEQFEQPKTLISYIIEHGKKKFLEIFFLNIEKTRKSSA